ncbi:MAG: protease HtpX [Elusimicrobiota bacterium]
MAWMKRIFLFGLVNLLVIVTISITLEVLGVRPYLTANGIDYGALMAFCLIWGMGGAFISLALSRVLAKWTLGVVVIDPRAATGGEADLVRLVHGLAERAGLPAMPEVGIYQSPELNAFATGPTRSRALVAVSSGLLSSMDRAGLEGVLGHELTHVANGDMVTMTLIQGVVNAFVMFIARVVAFALSMQVKKESRRMVQFAVTLVLQILLSLLGTLVVAWFSRWREFRADAGGARLAGREKMIGALQTLQRHYEPLMPQNSFSSFGIAGRSGGFMALMASHPPLEKRIEALRAA